MQCYLNNKSQIFVSIQFTNCMYSENAQIVFSISNINTFLLKLWVWWKMTYIKYLAQFLTHNDINKHISILPFSISFSFPLKLINCFYLLTTLVVSTLYLAENLVDVFSSSLESSSHSVLKEKKNLIQLWIVLKENYFMFIWVRINSQTSFKKHLFYFWILNSFPFQLYWVNSS